MKQVTLTPNQYRINHEENEHKYCITLLFEKWCIQLLGTDFYMGVGRNFDYYCPARSGVQNPTAEFDTPEEALAFWQEYINDSKLSADRHRTEIIKILEFAGISL